MSDYFSLRDLLSSTENMTYIRQNARDDDGTFTVAGVPWFKYAGNTMTNVFVSSNSWMGLGTNTEQLKVSRRDASSWNILREEGTLWGLYKFLRIRWDGFHIYNSENDTNHMTWDVVFIDTGDFVVNFARIPTSSLGESTLVTAGSGNIGFTPKTGERITFVHQDEIGRQFVRSDDDPILIDPYDRKYLISDAAGAIYTIETTAAEETATEGTEAGKSGTGAAEGTGGSSPAAEPVVTKSLKKLDETELTAELFERYGIDDVPDGSLILDLMDPTILYWHNSDNEFPEFEVEYKGVPIPQVLYSDLIDMSDHTIIGIENVEADADDKALFAVSFDEGATWWSCVRGSWAKLTEEKSGMSKIALAAITTDQWAEKATTGTLMYRMVISGADGYVRQITTNYLNVEE